MGIYGNVDITIQRHLPPCHMLSGLRRSAFTVAMEKSAAEAIWESASHMGFVDPTPSIAGAVIVAPKEGQKAPKELHLLDQSSFRQLMLAARGVAKTVIKKSSDVQRCALVADCASRGFLHAAVLPLAGVGKDWSQVLAHEEEFHEGYPGYVTSKNGPRAEDQELEDIQDKLISASGSTRSPKSHPDKRFDGDPADSNLFARLVRGELQQWRIWEDEHAVAFLTPFPSTPGFAVVVPRSHLSSDVLGLEEEDDYLRLMDASRTVGLRLVTALGARSFAVVCEGYEIDYAHVKVIPIHKSTVTNRAEVVGETAKTYSGFVHSMPGQKVDDEYLKRWMDCYTAKKTV